jgi:hypothetical protein
MDLFTFCVAVWIASLVFSLRAPFTLRKFRRVFALHPLGFLSVALLVVIIGLISYHSTEFTLTCIPHISAWFWSSTVNYCKGQMLAVICAAPMVPSILPHLCSDLFDEQNGTLFDEYIHIHTDVGTVVGPCGQLVLISEDLVTSEMWINQAAQDIAMSNLVFANELSDTTKLYGRHVWELGHELYKFAVHGNRVLDMVAHSLNYTGDEIDRVLVLRARRSWISALLVSLRVWDVDSVEQVHNIWIEHLDYLDSQLFELLNHADDVLKLITDASDGDWRQVDDFKKKNVIVLQNRLRDEFSWFSLRIMDFSGNKRRYENGLSLLAYLQEVHGPVHEHLSLMAISLTFLRVRVSDFKTRVKSGELRRDNNAFPSHITAQEIHGARQRKAEQRKAEQRKG